MKGYSIGDTIKNAFCLIYTKIMWRKARLIRLPFFARNRKNITMGDGFTCGTNCRVNPGPDGRIVFGRNFTMGDQCQIEAMKEVFFGDNVLLASKVYIGDASHGMYKGNYQSLPEEAPNQRTVFADSIHIGDNAWLGNGVSILGGYR